jgi:hypothetical protein
MFSSSAKDFAALASLSISRGGPNGIAPNCGRAGAFMRLLSVVAVQGGEDLTEQNVDFLHCFPDRRAVAVGVVRRLPGHERFRIGSAVADEGLEAR